MKRRLPLPAALAGAFAFVPKAWGYAWAVLLLLTAVLAAPFFLARHDARLMQLIVVVWPIALLVVGTAAGGALFRLGVAKSASDAQRMGLGIGGLQFGRPELRLLGAAVLVALFLGLVALALAVAGAFIYGATGLAVLDLASLCRGVRSGDGGAIVMAAYLALAAWALLQLSVRFSLYKPATVARGRMVTLDALSFSQGAFWSLLAGLAVVMIPTILLAALNLGATSIAAPSILNLNPARVAAVAEAAIAAFIQAPLAVGFLSEAYKRLEYWTGQAGGGEHG